MPQFSERPTDLVVVVVEGQNVTFPCKANGRPPPSMTWNFSSGPLPEHSIKNGDLALYKVKNTAKFERTYTCTASSRAGFISTNVSLVVDGEFCSLASY